MPRHVDALGARGVQPAAHRRAAMAGKDQHVGIAELTS
jgi:hypothetical protein